MDRDKTYIFKSYKGNVYLKVSEYPQHFMENMCHYKLMIPKKHDREQYFFTTFESNEIDLNKIKSIILQKLDTIDEIQANIIELNMKEWFNLLTYGKLDLDFSLLEEDNSRVSKSRVAYIDPGSDTNTIYITF